MREANHDNPVHIILTRAIKAYGGEMDEKLKFELSAYVFFLLLDRLSRKSGGDTASLMIILVLEVWRSSGDKLFSSKKECANVLMNRMKIFHETGTTNRAKVLLNHIAQTEINGVPKMMDRKSENMVHPASSALSLPSEDHILRWMGTLSPLMAGITGLTEKLSRETAPIEEKQKRSLWKWVFWFLAGGAAVGAIGVLCT